MRRVLRSVSRLAILGLSSSALVAGVAGAASVPGGRDLTYSQLAGGARAAAWVDGSGLKAATLNGAGWSPVLAIAPGEPSGSLSIERDDLGNEFVLTRADPTHRLFAHPAGSGAWTQLALPDASIAPETNVWLERGVDGAVYALWSTPRRLTVRRLDPAGAVGDAVAFDLPGGFLNERVGTTPHQLGAGVVSWRGAEGRKMLAWSPGSLGQAFVSDAPAAVTAAEFAVPHFVALADGSRLGTWSAPGVAGVKIATLPSGPSGFRIGAGSRRVTEALAAENATVPVVAWTAGHVGELSTLHGAAGPNWTASDIPFPIGVRELLAAQGSPDGRATVVFAADTSGRGWPGVAQFSTTRALDGTWSSPALLGVGGLPPDTGLARQSSLLGADGNYALPTKNGLELVTIPPAPAPTRLSASVAAVSRKTLTSARPIQISCKVNGPGICNARLDTKQPALRAAGISQKYIRHLASQSSGQRVKSSGRGTIAMGYDSVALARLRAGGTLRIVVSGAAEGQAIASTTLTARIKS